MDDDVKPIPSNAEMHLRVSRTDDALKRRTFWFIVGIISLETTAVLFIPYIKWISPEFVIDEWALLLLILGMLAQPYLILQIITKYLFSR